MRIGFIHPNSPSSEGTGAAHSATKIVQIAEQLGHDVTVYCAFAEPRPETEFSCRSFDTSGFPYHSKTNLNAEIRSRLSEFEEFDIVHTYLPSTVPALNTISKQTSTSTAVTLNAYAGICPKNDLRYMGTENCTNSGLGRCTRCIFNTRTGDSIGERAYNSVSLLGNYRLISQLDGAEIEIDGFHALSDHLKTKYCAFGYPEQKMDVIPNVVDESFVTAHRSNFESPYQLLYVGYLREHKGVQMLPKIAARLKQADLQFQMTVVGDGPMMGGLKRDVKRAGTTDCIEFRGHVSHEELPEIYADHDLFVYTGVWEEPFGRIFLESLCAGTPVVGTNVGAVAEIIGDAGTVTDPDPEALAEKIIQVLSSGNLKQYAANTQRSVQRYSREAVEPLLEEFYTSVRECEQ